jgi:hypothetical protein
MDLIERVFGLSPDGGNGTFELLCFAIVTLTIYAIGMAWQRRNGTTRR